MQRSIFHELIYTWENVKYIFKNEKKSKTPGEQYEKQKVNELPKLQRAKYKKKIEGQMSKQKFLKWIN